MSITDQILTLLDQYGWTEDLVTGIRVFKKQTTTVPSLPVEQNRLWLLQFSVDTFLFMAERPTIYIMSPAINSTAIAEVSGPVDPLYHDLDSLTARLIQLQ